MKERSIAEIRENIDKSAHNVVQYLIGKKLSLSTAESCTGGLLSSAVTSVSGASEVFSCGIVSYSIEIKEKVISVPSEIIEEYGVVSAETAVMMAKGVKELSESDIAVGITGLAGPNGDGELPVGTIYVAVAYGDKAEAENLKLYEKGEFGREANRLLTVERALDMILESAKNLTK